MTTWVKEGKPAEFSHAIRLNSGQRGIRAIQSADAQLGRKIRLHNNHFLSIKKSPLIFEVHKHFGKSNWKLKILFKLKGDVG